jgi:hypothetical protein
MVFLSPSAATARLRRAPAILDKRGDLDPLLAQLASGTRAA